jgi:tRNA threonylcarbamoyladenosine modification (KEOPS) complex  Pcc1 subunit
LDYIPTDLNGFTLFMGDLAASVIANKTRWGVPDDEATDLQSAQSAFKTLFVETQDPTTRTSVVIAERNDARTVLTVKARQMVEFRIRRNPAVTTADLIAIHLKPYNPPSPIPPPATIPEIEIETPHPRVLRIKFRVDTARHWGKPAGVHGLECGWVITDTPPQHTRDLLNSSFATRNPLELVFDEDERGQKVYFAARWESGAGRKGLWSDIFSAVIP